MLTRFRVLVAGAFLVAFSGQATALPLNLEMRRLRPDINFAARDVYTCTGCTLEQYNAIVAPAGWMKAAPRVRLSNSAVAQPLPLPSGSLPDADFIPELPGNEFFYIAQVLSAAPIASDPILGFLSVAQVQRDTLLIYDAGSLVHEVIDVAGNPYMLFTFDLALSESTYDLTAIDSLSGLGLPPGWTYRSRVLTEEFVLDSEGLATVFAQGNVGAYQRYTAVPEPGLLLLIAFGFGLLTAARSEKRTFPFFAIPRLNLSECARTLRL